MAQANFTAVMGGFGALTVPRVQAQLAAAERAGLGVVAAGRAGYAGYSSTAFWGYQIKDEPDAAEFAMALEEVLPACERADCSRASPSALT